MAEIRLAGIEAAQLPEVAAIHERAWPESALTAFGHGTLVRYYRWLLEGPHDAALVGAWQGDRLVGFCAAGVFRGAMNGFLRANRAYLMFQVARRPRLALSPLIRERLGEAARITLRYSRLSQKRSQKAAAEPRFAVLAIATDPTVRGAGAGRALMLEAEARARQLGHRRMVLSVHIDNHRAIRFYEQLGWDRLPSASGAWTGAMDRAL